MLPAPARTPGTAPSASAAPARRAAPGKRQRGADASRSRRPHEGIGVGDPSRGQSTRRAGPPLAAGPRGPKGHAGTPRRSRAPGPSAPPGAARPGSAAPAWARAEDLEVAPAHASVEGRAPRARSGRASGRGCGEDPLGRESKSSVRSGNTPPVACTFNSRIDRGRPPPISLIATVASVYRSHEHKRPRQPRSDLFRHVLAARGHEQEHLGEGLGARLEESADRAPSRCRRARPCAPRGAPRA